MKRIIHVDNSTFFRKQMKAFLEAEGYAVEGYDSAFEASMAIHSGSGDIVISALAFFDEDGVAFLEKILEAFAGPVFVVSSSIDDDSSGIKAKLLKMGVKATVSKGGAWKEQLKEYLAAL